MHFVVVLRYIVFIKKAADPLRLLFPIGIRKFIGTLQLFFLDDSSVSCTIFNHVKLVPAAVQKTNTS